MDNFDESIPPSRRIFRSRCLATRFAEVGFRWLAKGTMVVAEIVVIILSGGLVDLPSTRRQWSAFLAIILVMAAGVIAYCYLFPAPPPRPQENATPHSLPPLREYCGGRYPTGCDG